MYRLVVLADLVIDCIYPEVLARADGSFWTDPEWVGTDNTAPDYCERGSFDVGGGDE